jgi:DNA modification methylase
VGTTFAVCQKLKRDFIGFELNPDYVAIANERVQNIISQQEFSLFQ